MRFDPSTTESRLLQLNGMPGYLMKERVFRLDQVLSNYTSSTEGLKPLAVKRAQQIADYESVIEDPTHAPYLMCISSEPNDLAGKLLAASIALAAQRARKSFHWHTLIGGYKDAMRDRPHSYKKYDLLVFSNMPYNSTETKYEKLRDLLEMFSTVPRIVVTTGSEPVRFFNELGYHLHYPIWIRSQRTVRVLGNER